MPIYTALFTALLLLPLFTCLQACAGNIPATDMQHVLKVTSPAFAEGDLIPKKYTCDGLNINPPLNIQGVPEGTKSLALIVEDPDAPLKTWYHWLVWNISPQTTAIQEDSVPPHAVTGANDFKKTGYGGPCPPFGTHRYYFKVYALNTMLSLPSGAKKGDVKKAIHGHVLGEGSLMGKYARQR